MGTLATEENLIYKLRKKLNLSLPLQDRLDKEIQNDCYYCN